MNDSRTKTFSKTCAPRSMGRPTKIIILPEQGFIDDINTKWNPDK